MDNVTVKTADLLAIVQKQHISFRTVKSKICHLNILGV